MPRRLHQVKLFGGRTARPSGFAPVAIVLPDKVFPRALAANDRQNTSTLLAPIGFYRPQAESLGGKCDGKLVVRSGKD
jgi:hypothetical protein